MIELGTLLAGPFAGRLLGDMGAEVIKVEAPGQPDPLREWGQARYEGRDPVLARTGAEQEVRHAEPARAEGPGAPARARPCRGRRRRELPSRHARAVEPRLRAAVGGECRHRPRSHLRVRPDGAVRRARGLRVRRGGDGRTPLHQRLPRRCAAAHGHLARRLARRDVRRAGHPGGALPPRRARSGARAGRRRLAHGGVVRAARERRAGVRPTRRRP